MERTEREKMERGRERCEKQVWFFLWCADTTSWYIGLVFGMVGIKSLFLFPFLLTNPHFFGLNCQSLASCSDLIETLNSNLPSLLIQWMERVEIEKEEIEDERNRNWLESERQVMISGKDPSPSFFSIINFFPANIFFFLPRFSLASLPHISLGYSRCITTNHACIQQQNLLILLSLSLLPSLVKYSDCQTHAVNAHFFFFLTLEEFSCVLFFSPLSRYQLFHSFSLSNISSLFCLFKIEWRK